MSHLQQLKDPISAFAEVVSRLSLDILSVAVDVNFFENEIGLKGVAKGNVRLVNAMVLQVTVVCLTNRL